MLTRKPLPPEAVPDASDPNCYCIVRNNAFKSRRIYRWHLKNHHKMDLTPLRPKPDLNITPSLNNSSNHCDSCNWTLASERTYRQLLEPVHDIIIPRKKAMPNPNILPNINDLNFYCNSCQLTYSSRSEYRRHLKRIHKTEIAPLVQQPIYDPTISVDDTKNPNNTSCAICKLIYSNKQRYQKHMKTIHKDGKMSLSIE